MEMEWIRLSETEIAALRRRSGGVALLPLASIESHGPHLPLGSDPVSLRYVMKKAVQLEPAAVLPELPYSYVLEATRRPGAIHIDSALLMRLVENICDEVARNGFRKIVLVHGHGGNVALHWMFCKRILELGKPYAVYSIQPLPDMDGFMKPILETKVTGHACEMEASMVMAADESLVNLKRLHGRVFKCQEAPGVSPAFTTVEWVSRWPEMAVGDASRATRGKGVKILDEWARRVAETVRKVKKDRVVMRVMAEFAGERRMGGTLKKHGPKGRGSGRKSK